MKNPQTVRRRDAAATRSAILDSARTLFARESYENVGIRDIAAKAGVDAALVARYFGSKEDLFSEVMSTGDRGVDVIGSELDGLPERVAELLLDPEREKSMDEILIIMHSANSPIAGPLVRSSIRERFHDPFAEIIGGDNAVLRAQLFAAMLLGISISRQTAERPELDNETFGKLKRRISELIARAIAPL